MNAPRPNQPRTDFAENEALRQRYEPQDDVPKGKAWTPSAEDKRPLRSAPEHEIPSCIPLKLSQPQNASQEQISRAVYEDRGDDPRQAQRELPPDFDPEVDDENDRFVGMEGLHTQQSQRVRNDVYANKPPLRQQEPVKHVAMEHPVLQKLRESFGLKSKDVKTQRIGRFVFGFRKYSSQSYNIFVNNHIRPSVSSEVELMEKIGCAIASISIASIDGVPTHEVFGISLDPRLEQPLVNADPLYPPTSVIVSTALHLFPWLNGLAIPELSDTLVDTYSEMFPAEKLVQSKGIWKFVCGANNCKEFLERKPRYRKDGTQKPYYCPVHGLPMNPLGSLEELADFPLV